MEPEEAAVEVGTVMEAPRGGDAEDLRREAGLRGEALTSAAVALSAFFMVGLLVLVGVLLTRRRSTPAAADADGDADTDGDQSPSGRP